MYHYKVRVLNAKFDIDQFICMVIGDHSANQYMLQPHAGDRIELFNFDCVVINGFDFLFCFLTGIIGLQTGLLYVRESIKKQCDN